VDLWEPAKQDLSDFVFPSPSGEMRTLGAALQSTFADAMLVARNGELVFETYADGVQRRDLHLVNSITKTFTGMLAGIAVEEDRLDPEGMVSEYLPELAQSPAWFGTSVRHLLDMTAGIAYSEDYDEPNSDFWQETSIVGWRPRSQGWPQTNSLLYNAGTQRQKQQPDGSVFDYKTICTNVLALLLERVFEQEFPKTLSDRIWSRLPMGDDAAIVVDGERFAYAGAGLNVTGRDLLRFGCMLVDGGRYQDTQIIPERWLVDTLTGAQESKDLFAKSTYGDALTGWHYRNQTWISALPNPAFVGIGIHGQTLYANPKTKTVLVQLSSQPVSVDPALAAETLFAFLAIDTHLNADSNSA
jgi:hypothetical protein